MDVRRLWECPACGRRVKRRGSISAYQCSCQETPVFMRLVEGRRDYRPYQPYIVPEIDANEIIGDEEEPAADSPTELTPTTAVETVTPPEAEPPSVEEVVSPNPEVVEPSPLETPNEPTMPVPAAESESPPGGSSSPESPTDKKPRKGRSRKRRGRKRNRKPGSEGSAEGS